MRGNDIGDIGRRVGERVRIVRRERELTQDELSSRLAQLGRPMPTASIGRLESGDRRVDVDDLMALACALNVSPLSLLLRFTESPNESMRPAGVGPEMEALSAWAWAVGAQPYDYGDPQYDDYDDDEGPRFRARSHPWWLYVDARLDPQIVEMARRRRGMPTYRDAEDVDGEHQAEA